jgi:hypothetical protein
MSIRVRRVLTSHREIGQAMRKSPSSSTGRSWCWRRTARSDPHELLDEVTRRRRIEISQLLAKIPELDQTAIRQADAPASSPISANYRSWTRSSNW